MKSTIEEKPNSDEEIKFPILMEYIPETDNVFIVVSFHKPTCGTVVATRNSARVIGEYSTSFFPAHDRCRWKKFTGKVTLEN
jgi:hypothetical protein